MSNEPAGQSQIGEWVARRKLLFGAFLGSLGAAYGLFAGIAARFVFPARRPPAMLRVFVGFTREVGPGASKSVTMPSGEQVLISNLGRLDPDTGNEYSAFSNSCPHLGCKVHWDAVSRSFLCPCHQGVFNSDGIAVSGPPAASGSSLRPYPIEVSGDSIYALVEEA